MSLEQLDHSKKDGNHMGRCLFLLNQIKAKDKKVWREMKDAYDEIDLDETWEFSQKLLKIYSEL